MSAWMVLVVLGVSVVVIGVFIALIFTSMAAKHNKKKGSGSRKSRRR